VSDVLLNPAGFMVIIYAFGNFIALIRAMKYFTIEPSKTIGSYVRFFWVLEGEASEENPFCHRALADHRAELIFYYEGDFSIDENSAKPEKTFSSGLFAQNRSYHKFSTTKKFGLFGVYLYPYVLPELFFVPANEVSDQRIDLVSLLGKDGRFLEEKILTAQDNLERVETLTAFFEERILKKKYDHHQISALVKQIADSPALISIDDLVEKAFLSRRQFERRFKTLSGYSPGEFLRLVRFTQILKTSPVPDQSLAQMALSWGYYDQSHFISDFRGYSGYSPGEYFKQQLEAETYRASREIEK
jgi:AraC-like DNA-binding protein